MRQVLLTGRDLTLDDVVAVSRGEAVARLDPNAELAMERSRAVVDRLVEGRAKVYGLTTGFGSKKNVFIEPAATRELQANLIQSHSCGVGDPLDEDVVRATILLRANTLALGLSGIRTVVVKALLSLLDRRIYPFVPSQGSLGASGDLAPLSHLALVLTGDPRGRVLRAEARRARRHSAERRGGAAFVTQPHPDDFEPSTPEVLGELGFDPVQLEAKEGLALNNGTQVMTAIGLLTIADAQRLLCTAEGAAAMSFEALKGVSTALSSELHAARPHQGQSASAAAMRKYTEGSQVLAIPLNMAWINAALRSLDNASFHLSDDLEPLAEDIVENIRNASITLRALRDDPAAPLQGESVDDIEALGRYRAALEPVKQKLLHIYRSLLSSQLGAGAAMAQEELSAALSSLESAVPAMPRVQDAYSLRCTPQVLGAVRGAISHVLDILTVEANSATDNPLIFAPDPSDATATDIDAYREQLPLDACRMAVRSGGNFHGEPVALAMDYLAIAMSELANIAERRVAHMVDGHLNMGLPSLLIHEVGLNSGFMIPQYTAAALVSENKALAHPASVDSIPSCENTEDHVSMGTIAARKARRIVLNAEVVVSIELLTAYQALHFRRPLTPGPAARRITDVLLEHEVSFVSEDRPLYIDIETVTRLVRGGAIADTLSVDA